MIGKKCEFCEIVTKKQIFSDDCWKIANFVKGWQKKMQVLSKNHGEKKTTISSKDWGKNCEFRQRIAKKCKYHRMNMNFFKELQYKC